jgi:hypothetical protein
MAFVKLDSGLLTSTLWVHRDCREVFITALLMAEPMEVSVPMPQIEVDSLNLTGFVVPIGWYGFVPAAGVGILRIAQIDHKSGMEALRELGMPDLESRSQEFEGRRMVRVNGGFLILNYMKYRERDYTAAERSKRYREKRKQDAESKTSHRDETPSHRDITQAEAEVQKEKSPTQEMKPMGEPVPSRRESLAGETV